MYVGQRRGKFVLVKDEQQWITRLQGFPFRDVMSLKCSLKQIELHMGD